MSQGQMILKDLKQGKTITPLDALPKYGCFRLAARIYDLRSEGHDIQSEMVHDESGKQYAKYFLHKTQGI